MMRKKLFLLFVLAGAMPLTMMAQDDDLYFVPSKKSVETKSSSVRNTAEKPTYYAGSIRDVDEYNRRGKFRSSIQTIGTDSLGNDIIEFHVGTGIYPDTAYIDTTWTAPQSAYQFDDTEDYAYSRRMSRWDDYYGWYDPWFYGHWGWRPLGYYSWYDPWYYGPYGYGWYRSWYDPWYYGYYGWGYPYYYGWYGRYGWGYPYWHYPHYGWGGGGYAYYGTTGTRNHGKPSYNTSRGTSNGRSHSYSSGTFGGSRNGGFGNRNSATRGNTRSVSRGSNGSYSNSNNGNFGGSRSTYGSSSSRESHSSGSYSAPSRSSSTSSFGGSTYGGSRSGGGGGGYSGGGSSGGGSSRSGGGGGFGGRR